MTSVPRMYVCPFCGPKEVSFAGRVVRTPCDGCLDEKVRDRKRIRDRIARTLLFMEHVR